MQELPAVLRPGGTLIASTMLPDMDSSKAFVAAIDEVESGKVENFPPGLHKDDLLEALRSFCDKSSNLLRLEEEGSFIFWSPDDFEWMIARSGFESIDHCLSCGEPPLATIVVAKKP